MSRTSCDIEKEFRYVCHFVEDLLFYQSPESLPIIFKLLHEEAETWGDERLHRMISQHLDSCLLPAFNQLLGEITEIEEQNDSEEEEEEEARINAQTHVQHDHGTTKTEDSPIAQLKALCSLEEFNQKGLKYTSVATTEAIQLFEDIYTGLQRNKRHFETFVKYLLLYMEGCLSLPETLVILEELPISKLDILPQIKDFLAAREALRRQDSLFSKPFHPQTGTENGVQHSTYIKLVDDYPRPWCSGRASIPSTVRDQLNDDFVSIPRGSEDNGFAHPRSNAYQTAMFRMEDEMFELDIVIESAKSLVRVLNAFNSSSAQRRHTAQLVTLPTFKVTHFKVIARLYGDHANDLLDLIFRSPACTIPPLVQRLKERIAQWDIIRTTFISTTWLKTAKKNFYKQFDDKYAIYSPRMMIAHALYLYHLYTSDAVPQSTVNVLYELRKKIKASLNDFHNPSSMPLAELLDFYYEADPDWMTLTTAVTVRDASSIEPETTDTVNLSSGFPSLSTVDPEIQSDIVDILNHVLDAKDPCCGTGGSRELLFNFITGSQATIDSDIHTRVMMEWLKTFSYYPNTNTMNINYKKVKDALARAVPGNHVTDVPVRPDSESDDDSHESTPDGFQPHESQQESFLSGIPFLLEHIDTHKRLAQFPLRVADKNLYCLIRLYSLLCFQLRQLKYFTMCRRDMNCCLSQHKWDATDDDPQKRRSYNDVIHSCVLPGLINTEPFAQDTFHNELRIATANQGTLLPLIPVITLSIVSLIQVALKDPITMQLLFLHVAYNEGGSPCCVHTLKEYLYLASLILGSSPQFWIKSWTASPCEIRIWLPRDIPYIRKHGKQDVHNTGACCFCGATPSIKIDHSSLDTPLNLSLCKTNDTQRIIVNAIFPTAINN